MSPLPAAEAAATGQAVLLLAPRSLAHLVQPEERVVSGSTRFGVSAMNGCVLSYGRGAAVNGNLSLSNLAAYWFTTAPDGRQISKPDEFVRWGKRMFAIGRRLASETHTSYRASSGALRAFRAKELRPVLY